MTHAVIGLFDNKSDAQSAMSELVEKGFLQEDIDLSNRAAGTGINTGATSTGSVTGGYDDSSRMPGSITNAAASTANTAGDYAESVGDKVSNFFNSIFGDDSEEARKYSTVASDTEAILTVQTNSEERAELAADILDRNGAVDVDDRVMQYQGNSMRGTSSGTTADRTNLSAGRSDSDQHINIPVIEEDIQVGKRAVERGGVKVKSRIIEKPIEENIRLREEHVVVRRDPVNRVVSGTDLDNFREGEFEVTEHAEEAVVAKQARVKENISIDKTVNEREETVRDTVRRTEVEVDETKGNLRSADTSDVDLDDREDFRSKGASNR